MADAPNPTEPTAKPSAPSRTKLLLGAAVVLGLLAGTGAGALVGGTVTHPSAAAHGESASATAGDATKEHAKDGGEPVLHAVDNLVLNPAGTQGTRFLMLNVTFALRDAGAGEQLAARDAEVRDRLLAVLGAKTVDELSDLRQRDTLRRELTDAVAPLLPPGAIRGLFFPQFVIQ